MARAIFMDRDRVIASLSQLPRRVSAKTIFYRIHMLSSIQAGLDDIAAGRTFTQAEVEKRFALKRRKTSRTANKYPLRPTIRQKKS